MERKHFELKNVNEHYDQKSYDKPLLFTGKKFEVLILPYNHGHPTTFMRNIETNEKFMEVVGGGCSSWGEKKSWSLQKNRKNCSSLFFRFSGLCYITKRRPGKKNENEIELVEVTDKMFICEYMGSIIKHHFGI